MAYQAAPPNLPSYSKPSPSESAESQSSPKSNQTARLSSNGGSNTGKEAPVFLDGMPKIQRTTDKSCVVCRERRVRCGREWPTCTRCIKRREECVYGDGITVETKEAQVVDPRIKQLEGKLASLESQLSVAHQATPPLPLLISAPAPQLVDSIQSALPPLSQQESSTLLHHLVGESIHHQRLGPGSSLDWKLAQPRMGELLTLHLLDAAYLACCSRLASLKPLMNRVPFLKANLHSLNAANQAAVAVLCAVGARSSPHSAVLGLHIPGLADGTAPPSVYLGVGSRREKACRALTERAGEVCWLGGVITGMTGTGGSTGRGEGGEGWEGRKTGSTREGLETLVGLGQLLIFEEVRPKRSRFFLRTAVGMYSDLQQDLTLSDQERKELRQAVGSALYFDDAIHSAQLTKHPLIPTAELSSYFSNTGLSVPDFNSAHLSTLLEETLAPPPPSARGATQGGTGGEQNGTTGVTLQQLEKALDIAAVWVCCLQRGFARLTTARRPNAPSVLNSLQTLWTQIDAVHSSVQRLQNFFVNIQHSVPAQPVAGIHHTSHTPSSNFGIGTGKANTPDSPLSGEGSPAAGSRTPDPYATDHFVLLAVRADTRLVDLVNLIHEFLKREDIVEVWGSGGRDESTRQEEWDLVRRMRGESEMRVRKCLKLVAFYSRLYLSSQDKHVVHHLTMQLELLPSWTTLAVQTVGQPNGPVSAEFEVSNEELDWFLSALRLALFYTPKAATRLQELTDGKAKRSQRSSAGGTPSLSNSRPNSHSPPSPFVPQPVLHGAAPSFPNLGPVAPSNGQNSSMPNGLTIPSEPNGYSDAYPSYNGTQQYQQAPTPAPQQHQQHYSRPHHQQQTQTRHHPYSNHTASHPPSQSHSQSYQQQPAPQHLQSLGLSLPPQNLQLPLLQQGAASPALNGHAQGRPQSASYSPYRPSSSSLPSTSYPTQFSFNAYGFPSVSPHLERDNPFAINDEMDAFKGSSWMDLSLGSNSGGAGSTGAGGWNGKQEDAYGQQSNGLASDQWDDGQGQGWNEQQRQWSQQGGGGDGSNGLW